MEITSNTSVNDNESQFFSTHIIKTEYAVQEFEYEEGIKKYLPMYRESRDIKITGEKGPEVIETFTEWFRLDSRLQDSHDEAVNKISEYKGRFKIPVSSKIITIE